MEIAEALIHSTIFVLPTFLDNSPNSLAEAMAVGTPSIATNVGGIPSMIKHGEDGFLIAKNNPDDLAQTILKTINDKKLERIEQQNLANAVSVRDTEWWNTKILELKQRSANSESPEENLANQRLLNYLSLLSYMYADNALKNNKLIEAQKYLFIYEKADPDNTEVYYLKAVYYALQNNNSLALKSLETAVIKGFDDFERIQKDSHFHFSDIEMEVIRKGVNPKQ